MNNFFDKINVDKIDSKHISTTFRNGAKKTQFVGSYRLFFYIDTLFIKSK